MKILKRFKSFLNEAFSSHEFIIGQKVIVNGRQDSLTIDNRTGRISAINGTGSVSVEFDERFSDKLHGNTQLYFEDHCWNIDNQDVDIKLLQNSKHLNKITSRFFPTNLDDGEVIKSKMFFIKHTDKFDMISFLPEQRWKKMKSEKKYNYWTSPQRQELKIGKFFRKMFPNIEQTEVEKLVNKYKGNYNHHFKKHTFELVKGEDIRKYYLFSTYDGVGGRLHSSCMRKVHSQKRFDIYVENPDVCQMLILRSPTNLDKIIGRAIIWKTNKGTFMDRVYCANDADINLYVNYAKGKKWKNYEDGDGGVKDMFVKLQTKRDYGNRYTNPYMDTFLGYMASNNTLRTRQWCNSNTPEHRYNDY